MVKFRFMMGVVPGFGHGNNNLTPEDALEIGTKKILVIMHDWAKRNGEKDEEILNYDILPARAVYPDTKGFGCPHAGELGVLVEGECKDSAIPTLEKYVQFLADELGQETITVEITKDGDFAEVIHVCETGQKVEHYDIDLEQFTAYVDTQNDFDFCRFLQDFYRKNSLPFNTYVITGVVTVRDGHIEFSAVQNPAWGQEDIERYRDDMLDVMYHIAAQYKTNLLVELKDYYVVVDPSSPDAQKRIEELRNARFRKNGVKQAPERNSWESSDRKNNWKKYNPSR